MTLIERVERRPGQPLDLKQAKDLKDYLMGVHGLTEAMADQELATMDRAGRTRCEIDMAARRGRIKRHQFEYDPFQMNIPSVRAGL